MGRKGHPNKVLGNPRDAYTREPPTASPHQPLPVRESMIEKIVLIPKKRE
jgi:hypothetical protein